MISNWYIEQYGFCDSLPVIARVAFFGPAHEVLVPKLSVSSEYVDGCADLHSLSRAFVIMAHFHNKDFSPAG